jgi:hypothetical protein|tara:strand:+ start:61 stop:510 length:450 start_codon:yes stop_codon:yes gene_type:complete
MDATLLDCSMKSLSDQIGDSRMRCVTSDNDRASGRERCGCVATRCRKSEWKIRGAENGNGPNRSLHQAEVRSWQRFSIRQRFIVPSIKIVAGFQVVGEKAKLASCSAALAIQSHLRQSRFTNAYCGNLITARLNFSRYLAKKRGAFCSA